MPKNKQILWAAVLLFLSINLAMPPLHVRAQTSEDAEIPETFELVGETQLFQLYANLTTLAFKVLDKRSEYVWSSSLDEKLEEDRLNQSWFAFAESGISIDYLDQKAINKRVSITNSNTSMDVKPIDQGFDARVTFTDYGITLRVIVSLEENGVRVEVPNDSIQEENPNFKLGLIYIYPFLGATRGDSIPGYMFIPDGSGSLIRFGTQTKAKNMFYGRYYDDDLGMITYLPFDFEVNRPYKISVPVFGISHGDQEHAFISVIESGASFGELQVHPAGITTNFNFICNAFVYNQSYFQATNRSGAGVTTLQKETNQFDVILHYRFLTGNAGDYVGMAKSYQQYLVDKGMLKKAADTNTDIGIRLEFLGGDQEKILLWYRLVPMTTISQMGGILKDLGIQNPDVIYYGWQPLGASEMPPRSLILDGKLGTIDQLRALAEEVSASGGNFYLYLDPQAAFWEQGGYSPRNDLAMSITNANEVGYNRNHVNYYRNLQALDEFYSSLSRDVFSNPKLGLALDGISSSLYSDFKPGHVLNREDAIDAYRDLLAENNGQTAFYMPNDYMFDFMSAYYDMPLTDSGYIYTSETVPFLQIVLAGYVPYYGKALNFSSNLQDDLLRHADFGMYPSYFVTHEVTAKLLKTNSNWIYTSSYAQWKEEIQKTYQWLDSLLAPVKGQEIIARRALAPGVIATTYGNGNQIIVNYNSWPYSANGTTVEAKDAILRGVQP